MMKKIIEFFKNEHIITAIFTGLSIVVIAYVFKRIMHVQPTGLESSLPGFAFLGFEVSRVRSAGKFWARPLPWCLLCVLITAGVILRHVI